MFTSQLKTKLKEKLVVVYIIHDLKWASDFNICLTKLCILNQTLEQ